MASPAYSAQLASKAHVSGPVSLGGPEPGFLWVVRDAWMTYGSYFGFVRGGISIDGQDPWLYTMVTGSDSIVGVSHSTQEWHGRYVVPEGHELWFKTIEGDTVDVVFCGYVLSASGF